MKIIAVLTVHNRKAKTLTCLEALLQQSNCLDGLDVSIFMTDDGSTDGTAEAISQQYPQVRIFFGTGDLYWNGGMRLAFGEALKHTCDFYLWLNNDTHLFPDALDRLLETSKQFQNRAIISASTQDPETGLWTYGGFIRKHRLRPLKFTPVFPGDEPLPIETMNGNFVLIPTDVASVVGNLDSAFHHGLGDFDYGLRTRKFGIPIYLAPGYYGFCERNPPGDFDMVIQKRVKKMFFTKYLPPKDWKTYAKRYGGILWPVYFLSPYLKGSLHKKTQNPYDLNYF